MKICQQHWDRLRLEIDNRGLTHLIAGSSEDVMGIVERSLDGTFNTKDDFDPLLMANMLIWRASLEAGGMYLLSGDENGEPYCPLCELVKNDGDLDDWVNGACDDSLDEARRLGLTSSVQ
jgi:hypothetical protein